jgi:serine/threonine-protein kinase ULK/ATG1
MEYCSLGDLSGYIKQRKEYPALMGPAGGLNEVIVYHFLQQLGNYFFN